MKSFFILIFQIFLTNTFLFSQDPGSIKSIQKLSSTEGGLGELKNYETFGSAITSIGDLNNDGVEDIAVGSLSGSYGSVWVLFMTKSGKVSSKVQITKDKGGFTGEIGFQSHFGRSITNLGDLNKDGINDIAVGEPFNNKGYVWILFLKSDGTVKSHTKIGDNTTSLNTSLDQEANFGFSICPLSDIDKDGITDICVGAPGKNSHALFVLNLKEDGSVNAFKKVNKTTSSLSNISNIGMSLAYLGDIDGNNTTEVLMGNPQEALDSAGQGAVYIISISNSSSISSVKKITESIGGFNGSIDHFEGFGSGVANLGDLDGDKVNDIGVGAYGKKYGSSILVGKAYVILLNKDATVKGYTEIRNDVGLLKDKLEAGDNFGFSISSVGDYDQNKVKDMAVGAVNDNDGGESRGAVYIFMLNGTEQVSVRENIIRFTTLDLYPNPSVSGKVLLSFPQENIPNPFTVQVLSMTGMLLKSEIIQPGSQNTTLDLKHFSPGTYMVKAISNDIILQQKVIILK